MTPTTPLAGLLVGLLDGSVVVLLATLLLVLVNRRRRVPVPAPVTDQAARCEAGSLRPVIARTEHDLPHAA